MCDITFDAFAKFGHIRISQFGEMFDDVEWNSGWIECESKSFPGRTYYFNVKTRCSTWKRPVSRYIHVPRYLPQPVEPSSNEEQTLLMSDSENESDVDNVDRSSVNSICARNIMKKRFSSILLEMYYRSIIEYQWGLARCREKNLSRDQEHPEASCSKPEEGTDDNSERIEGEPRGKERSDGSEKEVSGSNSSSSSSSNDDSDDSSSSSSTSSDTNAIMSSGKSSECHVKKNDDGFESPKRFAGTSCAELRLKPIRFSDLLTEPPRKLRKKCQSTLRRVRSMRKVDKPQARREPVKIICEMYDTTTINYDPLPPELPRGVKLSNLSDTSVSSLGSSKWTFNSIKDSKEKMTFGNLFDCNVLFDEKELILSESSSDTLH